MGPVPYRRVARVLSKHGFQPVRQTGSHERWRHPDGRATTVPKHAGKAVRVGLLAKIARDAGIDKAEF